MGVAWHMTIILRSTTPMPGNAKIVSLPSTNSSGDVCNAEGCNALDAHHD
jgi:hypothetical protein